MMILFAAGVLVLCFCAVSLVVENRRLNRCVATSDAMCETALNTAKTLANHANDLRRERDGVIRSLISLASNVQKCGIEVPDYKAILRYASEAEVNSLLAEVALRYSHV